MPRQVSYDPSNDCVSMIVFDEHRRATDFHVISASAGAKADESAVRRAGKIWRCKRLFAKGYMKFSC